MHRKQESALGARIWAALLSFGLIGQVAWVVENMYFNVFLYNTITGDTGMIAAMVAASAVVAAVTTLVVGALFLLSCFFAPIAGIVPSAATAPRPHHRWRVHAQERGGDRLG